MARKAIDQGGSWLHNPNIGRRTGIDVKAGKNIRKFKDGMENFDDYWTDSSGGEDSLAVLQRENVIESPVSAVRIGLGVKPMSPFSASSQTSVPTSASTTYEAINDSDEPKNSPQRTPVDKGRDDNEPKSGKRANPNMNLNPDGDEVGTISRVDGPQSRTVPGSALSAFRTKKRLTYSQGSDRGSIPKDLQLKSPSCISIEDADDTLGTFKRPVPLPVRRSSRRTGLPKDSPVSSTNAEHNSPKKQGIAIEKEKKSHQPPVSPIKLDSPVTGGNEEKQNSQVFPLSSDIVRIPQTPKETTPKASEVQVRKKLGISPCFVTLTPLKDEEIQVEEMRNKSEASPVTSQKKSSDIPCPKASSDIVNDDDDELEVVDISIMIGKPTPRELKKKRERYQRESKSLSGVKNKKAIAPTALSRRQTEPSKTKITQKKFSRNVRRSETTNVPTWLKTFSDENEEGNETSREASDDESNDYKEPKISKNKARKHSLKKETVNEYPKTKKGERVKMGNVRKFQRTKSAEGSENISASTKAGKAGKKLTKKNVSGTKQKDELSNVNSKRALKQQRENVEAPVREESNDSDENEALMKGAPQERQKSKRSDQSATYRTNNTERVSLKAFIMSSEDEVKHHSDADENHSISSKTRTKHNLHQSKEKAYIVEELKQDSPLSEDIVHASDTDSDGEEALHRQEAEENGDWEQQEIEENSCRQSEPHRQEEVYPVWEGNEDLRGFHGTATQEVGGEDGTGVDEELEIFEISQVDQVDHVNDPVMSAKMKRNHKNHSRSVKALKKKDISIKSGTEENCEVWSSSRPRLSPVAWDNNEVPSFSPPRYDAEGSYLEMTTASNPKSLSKKRLSYSADTEKTGNTDGEEDLSPPVGKMKRGRPPKISTTPNLELLHEEGSDPKSPVKEENYTVRRSSRPRVPPVAWYNNEVPNFSSARSKATSSHSTSSSKKRTSYLDNTEKPGNTDAEEELSPPIVKMKKGRHPKISTTPNSEISQEERNYPKTPVEVKSTVNSRRSILRKWDTPRASLGTPRFAENLPKYTPLLGRKSNALPRYSTASPLHINERTCSQTPREDPYNKKKMRNAGKIVKPKTPNTSSPSRRSRRTRVERLDWKLNEKIVYKSRKSGGRLISGVEAADDREGRVNKKKALQKLVKKQRRRQKAPLTPRNMSTDKDVFCNIDARKQSGVTVVDPDTCEEVEVDCIRSRDTIAYRGPTTTEYDDSDPFISCKAILQRSFSAGKLVIRPLQGKERQVVKNGTMVFYIVHGKVALTLHRSTAVLESGDFFFIPRGNIYSVENLRNAEAKLTFFQIKDEKRR